jgi:tetratricopeptide (TPR) repeat protein
LDKLTVEADDLIQAAMSHPVEAYEQGKLVLEKLAADDHTGRSRALRAIGIAARLADTMSKSVEYAASSVDEAVLAGDEELEAEALMSLAGSHALSGDYHSALAVLEKAQGKSEGLLAAKIKGQRGAVLTRMGHYAEARRHYREVLPILVSHGDAYSEALNRQALAMVELSSGALDDAETELLRARGLFEELALEVKIAAIDHSLGVLASYRGDLIGALRLLDESERRYGELVDAVAEIQVSRCEVLLSAGLISESARLADSISYVLGDLGLAEDEAEAMLVAAQAKLAGGDYRDAATRAVAAGDLFAEQGRENWRAQAEHVEISALFKQGHATLELLDRARAIAQMMEQEQQDVGSFNARLTAASIAIVLEDPEGAARDLTGVAAKKAGPVEMRLQSWLAEALLNELNGDRRRAMAAARSGMELLDRYQAALGATDIRSGIEMHARRLGDLGLKLATESGEARGALQWMERTRARSLRMRPVSPPADDQLLTQLAELRQVAARMRGASPAEGAKLRRREQALQESIRRRTRMMPGRGREAVLGEVAGILPGALGARTLIEFGTVGDRLSAVVVHDGTFRLSDVGPLGDALKELESLRFTLRRLARRPGLPGLQKEVAERLDSHLFSRIEIADGPVVIVPTPELYATPWSVLPSLQHRSITVAPSADLWLRRATRQEGSGVVATAAGPDLAHAEEEIRAVASLHGSTLMWGPEKSRVDDVLEAIDGAELAHIASHAFFQFENPMFSSLRLGDGDLFVYDIERLRRPPRLVVLSSCDSGFSESRAGEELLGLSASLLAMGTEAIVASIGLVPDSEATMELMLGFHRGLIDGLGPAEALQRAQLGVMEIPGGLVAAASFICIGRD